MAKHNLTVLERFLSHIQIMPNGCWHWTGYLYKTGYGLFGHNSKHLQLAHRASYELHGREIPEGLALDHICHNPRECAGGVTCQHRRCVNPDHLEPATAKHNCSPERSCTSQTAAHAAILAKTHCPSGHPYDETNTRMYRDLQWCD